MSKKKSRTKKQSSESEIPQITEDTINQLLDKEPKKRKKKKSTTETDHYVNCREFEDSIREYYKTDVITNYLGESIRKIAKGLSYAGNFINYSFKDDMIGDAVLKMYQALKHKKFKLDHGFSPFSYFTTIAFHAFISRIKKEKKHHQLIADYRERNYDSLINADEENTGIRICSKSDTGNMDNSHYNERNA